MSHIVDVLSLSLSPSHAFCLRICRHAMAIDERRREKKVLLAGGKSDIIINDEGN
jgi:hypothetical protein